MTPNRTGELRVFAPAKINLTLHVTGQRADGYHLLDSLVVFASVGDQVDLSKGHSAFTISGPEAAELQGAPDNLVLRVARLFPQWPDLAIELTKNLPLASGIGGGSADAAAVFRGLSALCADALDQARILTIRNQLLAIGADIPMCVGSEVARVRGIGEDISALFDLPVLNAVLVNPRIEISTPKVFNAMSHRDHAPMPEVIPLFATPENFASWLAAPRNDLQEVAMSLEPSIGTVIGALNAQTGCLLARMSGSGATCFGLYQDNTKARSAARVIADQYPDWWVEVAQLGSQTNRASPKLR